MTPTWKNDLDTLVAQAMTFVKSVNSKPISAEPMVPPVLIAVEKALPEPPTEPVAVVVEKSFAEPPAPWRASEREEIRQRVSNFKAHQLRMQTDREDYYFQTMTRTRALIESTSKNFQ